MPCFASRNVAYSTQHSSPRLAVQYSQQSQPQLHHQQQLKILSGGFPPLRVYYHCIVLEIMPRIGKQAGKACLVASEPLSNEAFAAPAKCKCNADSEREHRTQQQHGEYKFINAGHA